jgi:hypothetical protein
MMAMTKTTSIDARRLSVAKHSKAELIRNVLKAKPDATADEINEFYKGKLVVIPREVHSTRWHMKNAEKGKVRAYSKKEKRKAPKKEKAAPKETPKKIAPRAVPNVDEWGQRRITPGDIGGVTPISHADKACVNKSDGLSLVRSLRYENAYLRWCLEGEKMGFFDTWLEESEKKGEASGD